MDANITLIFDALQKAAYVLFIFVVLVGLYHFGRLLGKHYTKKWKSYSYGILAALIIGVIMFSQHMARESEYDEFDEGRELTAEELVKERKINQYIKRQDAREYGLTAFLISGTLILYGIYKGFREPSE